MAALTVVGGATAVMLVSWHSAEDETIGFGPMTIGTVGSYEMIGGAEVQFEIVGSRDTLDLWGRRVATAEVRESAPNLETSRAIDRTSGQQVWYTPQPAGAEPSTLLFRRYQAVGLPWLFGSSVLAGREVSQASMQIPLWDGSAMLQVELTPMQLASRGDQRLVAFNIRYSSVPDGLHLGGPMVPPPGGTVVMREGLPVAIEVRDAGGNTIATLKSLELGDGPVAWAGGEASAPASPFEAVSMIKDPPGVPPAEGPPPGFFPTGLAEAVRVATDEAPGLRQYEAASDRRVLFVAAHTESPGFTEVRPADPLAVNRSDFMWHLVFATEGSADGWFVDVQTTTTMVAGFARTGNPEVQAEGATRVTPRQPALEGEHVDLSALLRHLPAYVADYQLEHVVLYRHEDVRSWSFQPRFTYMTLYQPMNGNGSGASLGFASPQAVLFDSRQGSLHEIQAFPHVMDAFDEQGMWDRTESHGPDHALRPSIPRPPSSW